MLNSLVQMIPSAIFFALLQTVAALPWLAAIDPQAFKGNLKRPSAWINFILITLGLAAALVGFFLFVGVPDRLRFFGRIYGAFLHAQLIPDLFAVAIGLMLLFWPHGGAVAQAAFREGVRQPMFWMIFLLAMGILATSPFVPYFTFGEDFKMVQELGYETIMLATLLFGILAAAISISEEIEGRTAVTVMSKPVSRRQFLLGKYFGILLASFAMAALLGWCFCWISWFKPWYDDRGFTLYPVPSWVQAFEPALRAKVGDASASFAAGIGMWGNEAIVTLPGLVLGSGQATVLIALAVGLATRLPMILNLVACLVVFFIGHLTPVLLDAAQRLKGSATGELIGFIANLFNIVLPQLAFFSPSPMVAHEQAFDAGPFAWYMVTVFGYALIYGAIAMLLGLILFEDRDLA